MPSMIILLAICLLSIVAGYLLALIRNNKEPMGTLRLDRSDPDEPPYLFLELDDPSSISKIEKKSDVTFRVNLNSYIS